VLKNLDIDPKRIRQEIDKLRPPAAPGSVRIGQIPFSPRAKRAIELAGEAAAQLHHDDIGTEHLVLGLIQEKEGIAAQVLDKLGLQLDEARDKVKEVLGTEPREERPPSPPVPSLVERNLFDRAHAYLALTDRPALQDSVTQLLLQGRSVALSGPSSVGKTSLVFALSRAKAGSLAYWSIDHRIFDEFHRSELSMPKRPGTVCFVPEGELLTASRSLVADLLDERRRGGERLLLEFREGGLEAYAAKYPDLAKELARLDVTPPARAECAELLESARPRLRQKMGLNVSGDVLREADRLARARWPKLVAPWATILTLWKAAAIQNESGGRGDMQRLEADIAALEKSTSPQDRLTADALRKHVDGLRGSEPELPLESVRQAIGELADKPGTL
jgi:ATP-dependent Clp protease ATP-binding subunit ClpA